MSLQLACVLPLYQIPSCNWKLARDSHLSSLISRSFRTKLFGRTMQHRYSEKRKITQTPCIQLIVIIETPFHGVFATSFFLFFLFFLLFVPEYELRDAADVSLEAAFRLINRVECFSSSRERGIARERICVREWETGQTGSQWPDRKVWRKVKATKLKSKRKRKRKKGRQNCVRFYDWLRSLVRPSSWRNRCSPSASKALTSRRERS